MATDVEKLFEELMEYTDFNNIDEIETGDDLKDYFRQLESSARTKKQKNQFRYPESRTRQALLSGYKRLKRNKKEVTNKRKAEVVGSRKLYNSFTTAKEQKRTIFIHGKEVYKSYISYKGKQAIRWRDSKGRFAKVPKE